MGTVQLVFAEDPCGGSRGSDHCACLTGSDRKSRDFFPYFFPVPFPPFHFPYYFRVFFPSFFLSSSTKCLLWVFSTTSASYNHRKLPPFLFSYIRCSLLRPRPITIGNYHLLFSYIIVYMLCNTPRVSASYNLLRTSPYHYMPILFS